MKKTFLCLLSLILVLVMLVPLLASCTTNIPSEDDSENSFAGDIGNEIESGSF